MSTTTERSAGGNAARVEPLLVSDAQAAAMFGISRRKFWAMVSAGQAPEPVRLPGRCTRWRVADLKQHIESL